MAKTQEEAKKSKIYTRCSKCNKELPVFNHTGIIFVKFGRTIFNLNGESTGRVTDEASIGGLCNECSDKLLPKIRSLFYETKTIINDFKENQNEQE